jgi:hypothetical protein
MPETSETMACPWCGETILAVAKKCKHCGSFLTEEGPQPPPPPIAPPLGKGPLSVPTEVVEGWKPDPTGHFPDRYWDGTQWRNREGAEPTHRVSHRWPGDRRYALSVEFTDAEWGTLLRALFELSITQSAFDDDPDRDIIPIIATIPRERIDALVRKLGGDPEAPMFGGS